MSRLRMRLKLDAGSVWCLVFGVGYDEMTPLLATAGTNKNAKNMVKRGTNTWCSARAFAIVQTLELTSFRHRLFDNLYLSTPCKFSTDSAFPTALFTVVHPILQVPVVFLHVLSTWIGCSSHSRCGGYAPIGTTRAARPPATPNRSTWEQGWRPSTSRKQPRRYRW